MLLRNKDGGEYCKVREGIEEEIEKHDKGSVGRQK